MSNAIPVFDSSQSLSLWVAQTKGTQDLHSTATELRGPGGACGIEEPGPSTLTSSLHPRSNPALIPPFEFLSQLMQGNWRYSWNRTCGLLSTLLERYKKIKRCRLTEVCLEWPGFPDDSAALNPHWGKGIESKFSRLENWTSILILHPDPKTIKRFFL